MNSNSVLYNRKYVLVRVFKIAACLFVVALVIKLYLQLFTPPWLASFSERLKILSAYKCVGYFSENGPDVYILLSFFYLFFVILSLISFFLRYKYYSFKETAFFYLRIKRMSWIKTFLLSLFSVSLCLFFITSQVTDPIISVSYPAKVLDSIYSGAYLPFLFSFLILLPVVSWTLSDCIFILVSMIIYRLCSEFRESVNQ